MLLPTPNTDEVSRFQALYRQQYGVDLPAQEALCLLTRLVQFYYLTGGHDAHRQRLKQQALKQQASKQQTSSPAHEDVAASCL